MSSCFFKAGSERKHCNTYRLVVIAEKKRVYSEFPTPLVNRLEKHFVNTSSVLSDWQLKACEKLKEWIGKFSSKE